MSDTANRPGYHERLTLQNFTAFKECTMEFVPGVNVFVGENGTGKTHAMKALYAMHLALWDSTKSPMDSLLELFQTRDRDDIVRTGGATRAIVQGVSHHNQWNYDLAKIPLMGSRR